MMLMDGVLSSAARAASGSVASDNAARQKYIRITLYRFSGKRPLRQ